MENFEVGYSLLSEDERAATMSMTVSLIGRSDTGASRVEGEGIDIQEDESSKAFSGSSGISLGSLSCCRLSRAQPENV